MAKQFIFERDTQYFLVDIYDNGEVTLKIKDEGWSDTWSLPIKFLVSTTDSELFEDEIKM